MVEGLLVGFAVEGFAAGFPAAMEGVLDCAVGSCKQRREEESDESVELVWDCEETGKNVSG